MILKIGMKHQGDDLYKLFINHIYWDDLDLFHGMVNIGCPFVKMSFEGKR